MTIFATIEHSASQETIRTMEWISGSNDALVMRDQFEGSPPRNRVTWIHLSNEEMDWLRRNCTGHRLVTTARNRGDIAQSWTRRGKSMNALQEQIRNHDELLAMGAWVVIPGRND